jgi:8-oxo-dGTP diphosphatase
MANSFSMTAALAELVAGIAAFDPVEVAHQSFALGWLASTADIYRRVKPATPSPHLVAYMVLADPSDWSIFLVDHRLSGLWLPAGGHVEPGEDPLDTVRRETTEELGILADLSLCSGQPAFVTVTPTRPVEGRHTDVSLWYVLAGARGMELRLDAREFAGGRWWTPDEILAADQSLFDPHMGRFLAKMLTA